MAKRLLPRPLPRQLQSLQRPPQSPLPHRLLLHPQVEQGIPADVVAAIMAAIYSMGNGKYVLKAVRRGKNGWGKAGVNDTTAPF